MASTDIQFLADAEYARLSLTRIDRAHDLAERLTGKRPTFRYDNVLLACIESLAKVGDVAAANRLAREQHREIAWRRAQQNIHALEDRRIERAVALQPRLGKVA